MKKNKPIWENEEWLKKQNERRKKIINIEISEEAKEFIKENFEDPEEVIELLTAHKRAKAIQKGI